MTTTVRYELPDSTRSWSWPGSGENDKTPTAFQGWYSDVLAYCRESTGQVPTP
jgi:hypothetical protein